MKSHNFVRAISFVLIALLATASVRNIHDRSVEVHTVGGWHIWNISIGFALFFALSVYAAMVAKRTRTKVALAPIALMAGAVTSAIQTGLYLNHGAGWLTAIAFGVGVPAAEGALAIVDALMEQDALHEDETAKGNGFLGRFGSAVGDKMIARIEAQPAPAPAMQTALHTEPAPAMQTALHDAPQAALHDAPDIPDRDALDALPDDAKVQRLLHLKEVFTMKEMGEAWGVTGSTATRWINKRLPEEPAVHVNGNGKVIA